MKFKKFISTILIICILNIAIPINAFKSLSIFEESSEITKNSLHFIVHHWHDVQDENNSNSENEQLIDIVEGYIVPNAENKYKFYFVDENTNEIKEITDNPTALSPYIESINADTGIITLPIKPIHNENNVAQERFSGISLSAGHNAVDSSNENSIQISYQSNIHLVKVQIFYSNEGITVFGAGKDDAVFGNSDIQENMEQDTAWVYTYKKDIGQNKKGDIVKDANQKPVYDIENLPGTLVENQDVQKVKVYSTLAGLHTDKTVSAIDGRTFNVDLESWFSGAPTANVGLILDASGSMSFTSDDLKPININDLNLSTDLKEKLSAKILKSGKYEENPSADTWLKEIFLTNEEVNSILNIYNVDDSKLSGSDYSYYIFDGKKSVNEYVALGYWDGSIKGLNEKIIGYYPFNRGSGTEPDDRDWLINSITGQSAKLVNQVKNNEDISFENAPLPDNWVDDPRIKMDTTQGMRIKNIENGVGVLLDAVPSSSNFSITFSISKDTGSDKADPLNYTDLLYVGELDNQENSHYLRIIRDGRNGGSVSTQGNSCNRLRGYNDNVTAKNKVSDINTVFSTAGQKHTVTLVFNEGKLTTYMDGEIAKSNNEDMSNTNIPVNLTGKNIILNGFNNDYNGADLFIDNVMVIDAPLNLEEVQYIEKLANGQTSNSNHIIYNKYNNNGDFKSIGMTTSSFVKFNKGLEGWYYVNYDSNWEEQYYNENIESCKRYLGIPSDTKENLIFEDTIKNVEQNNTGYTYDPEQSTPTLFYIDEGGYLRCFYSSGTRPDVIGTSFVYLKEDNQHIKSEILQRAIGEFALNLNNVSPDSKISAVRFNTDKVTEQDYDKLVLLDWTNDVGEAQSMMSLKRGNGGTREGTPSKPREGLEPITQYNYGFTGGTATYTGLQSFYQNLSTRVDPLADKYLIIFTDGKDSTEDDQRNEAISIANTLKEAGYTIYSVMLTGGSVAINDDANSEYQLAKEFLLQLVGTTNANENKEDYFFSSLEGSNSIDSLTQIFTNNILKRITYNLNNYTVKDYIDPRFDLVSSDNNIYTLNANGNVIVKNEDGIIISQHDVKTNPISVALSNNYIVDEEAKKATLHFDNDMYYLVWENQIIPGCTINAKRLPVWNAQITLRAKDDFIGGNAILTNGNLEKMNFVYYNEDTNYSSGIEDAYIKDEDSYPSKGFPRVTVNVSAPEGNASQTEYIYLGENISKLNTAKELWESTYKNLEGTSKNYLEYIQRYALKNNETLSDYGSRLINGEKIKIPYYYIPNAENSNQTGSALHENDLLGYLEYQVLPQNVTTYPEDGIVKDKDIRKMVLTVKYIPLDIDQSQGQEEYRKKQNTSLITDSDYAWSEKYKPSQGDIAIEKNVNGDYSLSQISGEIALQLKFSKDILAKIDDNELKYQIDLVRNYGDTKETIGTFKAVYQKNNLPEADEDGNIIIQAKLEYKDEYQYMATYGLPLGKYTVENPVSTNSTDIKFDTPKVVSSSNLYTKELFSVGTDADNPQDYIALLGKDNTITLGAQNEEKDYRNYRFGLIQVAATNNVNQSPDTDKENKEPSTDTENKNPSTNTENKNPSTNTENKNPSTNTEYKTPSTSTEEKTPSVKNEVIPNVLPKTGDNYLPIIIGLAISSIAIAIAAEILNRKFFH